MSAGNTEQEPVTFVDKRKIDPETGEVRDAEPVAEPLAGTGTARQERSLRSDQSVPPGSVDIDGVEEVVDGAVEETADDRDVKINELTDSLQRLQAEYTNYRRRQDRERQSTIDTAKASVLGALLPVLDDLDRARAHGDLESGPLKAVADKLAGVFDGLGVKPFGVEGEPFDPAVHEAVQHEGDGSNPVLGVVMRQGYRFGEKVLRTAMVGVVDAVPEAPAAAAAPDEADPASVPDQQ
ncbi:nucleotide exchange factor GrpE [Aldersonia sp. NBC_00410]|uniref:nucleotide exchange factor GrpE n=1 Tax=Aldersonia sp. NBC_00410 TaxID=2975954 RepID=UPI0022567364|nr:nucleotide exchange factor GrpE [Aldersonia sp. NBC_00410]MCX5042026.1 nucleotide exchange factor GrpE [Aldersonia sp. NBC_00410]